MARKKIFKTAKGYDFKSKDGSRYPLEMENGQIKAFTVKVKGNRFSCFCAANVFKMFKRGKFEIYVCNACEKEFEM